MKAISTLIITENYPPSIGGVSSSVRRNALFLKKTLKEVQIMVLDHNLPPGHTEIVEMDGITVNRLGKFDDEALSLQLCGNIITSLQEQRNFTVLQGFYGLQAGYLAAFHGRLTGTGSIVNMRGNDIDRGMYHRDHHSFLLWTLGHADIVTCVTRDLVRKSSILSGRKDIEYCPNSVDGNIFRPLERDIELMKKYNLENRFVLGFFGELRMKKGVTFILEALKELADRIPVTLLLVGTIRKSEKEFFLDFLEKQKSLKDKIVHIRYISDPVELCRHYNLVDAVLSPSLWEGMPNAILEAMACGRIVIASDAGGAKDIIDDGENGFLVKTASLHTLKDSVLKVFGLDPSERNAIEQKAREKVTSCFTPAHESESQAALYWRLASLVLDDKKE